MSIRTAIIILLAMMLTGGWINSCVQKEEFLNDLTIARKDARFWRDAQGRSRVQLQVVEASKEALEVLYKDKIDSVKKTLKIKEIESITEVQTKTEIKVEAVVRDSIVHDTVYVKTFTYRDKWTKINGVIHPDKVELDMVVRDSITFVTHHKRGFLGTNKRLVMEGISHNPNTEIYGLKSIKVKPLPPKKLSIGIGATYGITSNGLGMAVGLTFSYSLIRF